MINKTIQKNKFLYRKKQDGFVLLFSVTIASILLSIALGVANVAFRELKFSSSGRDTNNAFLAADTGVECALANDKLSAGVFPIDGPATNISCAGNTITPVFTSTVTTGSYDFIIPNLGSSGSACAKVNITKNEGVDPTLVTVTSNGYNVGDGSCNSTNPNRTERRLRVSSYVGDAPTADPSLVYSGPLSETYLIGSGPLVLNSVGEYIVTPNVNMTITVKAWGGGGGTISPANRSGLGGGGGFAESSISLISGTPYKVWVAGGGAMSITGGFGGGGNGGAAGGIGSGPGGGGGGSSVFFDSDNTTRKVAAGGGGGGGSTGDGDSGSNNSDSNGGAVGSNGVAGYQGFPACAGAAAAGLYTGNYSIAGTTGGNGGRTGTPEQKLDNAGGGGGGGGGGGTGGGGGGVSGYCSGGGGGGGANFGSVSTQNGSGATPGGTGIAGWDSVAGVGGNGAAGARGLVIIQ